MIPSSLTPILAAFADHDWKDPTVQIHQAIAFAVGIGAIVGLIWSLIVLWKGKSQSLGPVAMILFCTTFLGGALVSILNPPELIQDFQPFISAIIWALGLLAAIVSLAIYRGRNDVYPGGPHAGVWSLILNGLALCGLFYYVSAKQEEAEKLASESKNPRDQSERSESEFIPPVAGEPTRFEDENFTFVVPERPWMSLDPKLVDPTASVVLSRYQEETVFIVVAERMGVEIGMTNAGIRHIAMENMKAAYEKGKLGEDAPIEIDGITFVNCRCEGSDEGVTAYHRTYAAMHNGYAYQMIGVSEKSWEETDRVMNEMARRFELIDPEAVCYSSGKAITEPVVIQHLGMTANLQGSGWLTWDSIADDFADADFGAQFGAMGSFGLLSFDLQDHEVSVEDLAAATLWVMWGETDYPDELDEIKPFDSNGVAGLEMRMTHLADSEEHLDVIRVFEHEGRGWCLILWASEAGADRLTELTPVLDLIEPGPALDSDSKFALNKNQRIIRSKIFNRLGLKRFGDDQYEEAAALFQSALNFAPENATYALNIAYSWEELQKYQTAIEALEKYRTDQGKNAEIAAEIAWNLDQSGKIDKALDRYEEAFKLGHGDENRFYEYIQLLGERNREEDALAAIDVFEKRNRSDMTLIWRADILDDLGRTAEAIEALQKRLEREPFDGGVAYDLAEYHLQLEEPEKCLEVCQQIIENEKETWDVAWLRGQAYMSTERYRDAQSAYEVSIELNSENEYLKHALARASAALGEGDNSLVKNEIEAVEIPDELQQLLEEKAGDLEDESYGAQVLRRIRVIHFRKGHRQRETMYLTVRITGERGISAYKMLRYQFDPFSERLFINTMIIRDEKGDIITKGDVNDFYVMDEAGQSMATDNQTLNAPVPGLTKGVTLELAVTRETLANIDSFQLVDHVFYDNYPCRYETIAVTGEVDKIKWETEGELDTLESDQMLAWSLHFPQKLTSEPLQPSYDRYLPSLWISSADKSWKVIGEEYAKDLEPLLSDTPTEVTTAAKRVAGDAENIDEAVVRLATFVRKELTYNAIEFGPRGRIPPPAGRTLRNRYGDCKDHSLLLYHLLKSKGIESYLTLANTDGDVREGLPDLNQFNHMILFVPGFRGGQFIDCTDDYLATSSLPPYGLASKRVLVLQPGNPRLETISEYPVDSNRLEIIRKIGVSGLDLVVEEEAVFSGYRAANLRDYFAVRDPEEHRSRLQSTFQVLPGLRLKSVKFTDFEDLNKPLRILLEYTIAGGAEKGDDRSREVELPAPWELYYLKADYIEDRRSPFELERPTTYEVRFEFTDGQKWKFAKSDSLDQAESSEFAQWSSKLEDNAVIWNFSRESGQFDAEKYKAFVDATDAALKIFERETKIVPR
ncbi:MAG: tetratricopeptide (TPR) repeat protein/transglutaminase-like putative cysteine protease [Verrucomicrobiales bacterium]|jgi:tetratricopeptide (TPR) repeat protein/transglutaminase-like putative cysteine protease